MFSESVNVGHGSAARSGGMHDPASTAGATSQSQHSATRSRSRSVVVPSMVHAARAAETTGGITPGATRSHRSESIAG